MFSFVGSGGRGILTDLLRGDAEIVTPPFIMFGWGSGRSCLLGRGGRGSLARESLLVCVVGGV